MTAWTKIIQRAFPERGPCLSKMLMLVLMRKLTHQTVQQAKNIEGPS